MTRRAAAMGSAAFFAAAPGVVAGVIPWWLTGWHVRSPQGPLVRVGGACLLVTASAALISAFARFASDGIGTPAPIAPTQRLVVQWLYRHVRNPMYLAVLAAIAGQAAILGDPGLVAYGAVVGATMHVFVVGYEEPALSRRFGRDYATYRRAVRRWLPRVRRWDSSRRPRVNIP